MNPVKEKAAIAAMLVGIFMASLDNTIVSASIHHILKDIGGFSGMSWVFTAYILASTSTMLVFGKLADLYGRKTFFLIGTGLFLIGSALCGTASTIHELIGYRILQGVGAGALLPISFTLIFSIFADPKKASKMTGLFAAVFGLSSVLGPQLGTWIADAYSWRWCFYVNIPLGLLAFFTLLWALKETKAEKKPVVDYLGALLLMGSTISLILMLEWGGVDYPWNSLEILGLALTAAAGATLFITVEQKAKEPILPLHLFKIKTVSITSFVVFCQGVLMFSAITYLPIFAVGVLGKEGSNGLLTPMMASLMAGAAAGGFLLSRFSYRTFYTVATGSSVLAAFLLSRIGTDTNDVHITLLMLLIGFLAIGPLMSIAQNAVAASIPKEYLGTANALVSFWRNLGGITGAAMMAAIVNRYLEAHTSGQNPEALLTGAGGDAARKILSTAINHGFWFALAAAVAGFTASLFLGSDRFHYREGEKGA